MNLYLVLEIALYIFNSEKSGRCDGETVDDEERRVGVLIEH